MPEAQSAATEAAEAGETAAVGASDAQETPPTEAPATNGVANGEAAGEAENDAVAGPEAALPSWRDGIPDNLRKSADQFTSPTALLKSYAELRKQFNKAIQPLPDKPDDEQLAAFRKKAGIPETAEGYGVKPPEWLDEKGQENFATFLNVAHQSNMAPDQVKATLETWAQFEQARAEADIAAVNAHTEAGVKALKEEWPGGEYDTNIDMAQRAILHFAGPEVLEELKAAKLEGGGMVASLPGVAKAFAAIGRASSEMTGILPSMTGENSKEDLVKERRDLMESKDYWTDKSKQARSLEISELLVGKAPHSGPSVIK